MLQMFKVKGQRSRSQVEVEVKVQSKCYNTAVDKFSDFKVGMAL